jgi:hypothetical protein
LGPTPPVGEWNDEREGAISSIPCPREVEMSITINRHTTDDHGGQDDVSRRRAIPGGPPMTAETKLEPANVNVRIKISALWASMLFVFVYVDLFSLYRPDFRADVEAGTVGGFTVNQSFLLGTTAYVVIPALMVFLSLILRPRVNRIANIALPVMYALTIIGGAIGEWNYYILGSAIEVMLLAGIAYYAWIWPKEAGPTSIDRTDRQGERP